MNVTWSIIHLIQMVHNTHNYVNDPLISTWPDITHFFPRGKYKIRTVLLFSLLLLYVSLLFSNLALAALD